VSVRAGWVVVLALGLALGVAAPGPASEPCADLITLALPDTTITSAVLVPASSASPAFCGVQGVVAPAVQFEVRMPATGWNGKFQGVGNGAFAGNIATGSLAAAVVQGYAAASTDTGHVGSPIDASWALGHPELVVDFGHRGIHVMTVAAKAIVEAFYGTPPTRSYFLGCSTGGKQALTEAQRYPDDYDGIVAGAPANYFTHLVMASNWIAQALHEDPASVIPTTQLPLIADAVLARCDAKDGIVDGVLDDPRRCRFRPGRLRCKGAAAPTCLTAAQVDGLKKVYTGPRLANGTRVFPGHPPGGEVGSNGWGTWIASTGPTLGYLIQDSFFRFMVFEDAGFDWRTVEVDRDMPVVDAKLAAVLNATDPDLTPFQSRGGKLLMYHGWSDAAISPLNSIDYWKSVVATARGNGSPPVEDFLRLFMVPGMQHCGSGPGPNTFDALAPLERWVEQDIAPDEIIATHATGGTVDRTRPLCPYPLVARWDGVGSTDDATSFSCARRRRRFPRG
jgi:feruloyl esterase